MRRRRNARNYARPVSVHHAPTSYARVGRLGPENNIVRRSIITAIGLLVLAHVPIALAQAPAGPPNQAGQPGQPPAAAGEIRGKIVESKTDQPVARASVSLRAKGGTAIITGAIASPDGSFRLQGLRPGAYSLRATYIGFAPIVQDVTLTAASPVVNVGNVVISRVAVELSAVSVQEGRSTVVVEPDRTSYRARDVAPAAANASEVLDAVPSVQVDGDGKVSLRGNENVAVQINGRPTPMRGTQLAAYLKSLPSNVIERVEVVPNPSAKYDPDGMAGIINIVLKSNVDLGLSAGLNTAVSTADRFFGSGNLGYQSGPFSSFTSAGFNRDARAIVGINDRERYDALRALQSVTAQDIDSDASNAGENLTTSLDYKPNKRDVLSNALTLNHRSSRDASMNLYSELDGARAPLDSYFRPKDSDVKGWMFDYNAALKRTFEPRKHEIGGEVRFNRAHDEDSQALWRQTLGTSPVSTEREIDATDAITKQLTGQVDYVRTLKARTKLETGYKGTARWLDRDFDVQSDSLGTGAWVRSAQSNSFEFDESVHAAYGVFSQGVGKFDLQAGLRAERAGRDFALAGTGTSYPYEYNSLFPSGIVMFNATQTTQLKASYSRRIRRPGTQELNPFASYFDVNNVFLGNPALAPEYTNALEFGVTRNGAKTMVQLSPFYRRTTNIIRVDINTTDTIAGREVTSISFRNLATSNSWGADLNGSLRLGPKFNGFAGFNVYKMVTDGGSTTSIGSDAVTWMGRVNGSSELTKTVMVQASYFYRAPMKIERGQFERMHQANVSVRTKLNGDQATMTLRVNDPFNTGAFRVRAGDDKVMQITERSFGTRMVWLAFNYNYGRPPRMREQRREQEGSSSGFVPPP
ncbi:MAG TPA: TonB-dependent receptor [Gemmatimonadaceae bacterium]|nr:TonB-dependent receptor [Gemmatimonadaceae bacterium]